MAINALAFIFFFLLFPLKRGKEKEKKYNYINYYSTLADLSHEPTPRQVRKIRQVHTIHHPDGPQCGKINTHYTIITRIQRYSDITHYPDIQLKGRNITIARAQQLDSTITDLTTDNAADLVGRVGVRVRARAVCAPAITELIQAAGVSTQKTNIINVPKILRANDNGGNTSTGGTSTGGDNPNDGND